MVERHSVPALCRIGTAIRWRVACGLGTRSPPKEAPSRAAPGPCCSALLLAVDGFVGTGHSSVVGRGRTFRLGVVPRCGGGVVVAKNRRGGGVVARCGGARHPNALPQVAIPLRQPPTRGPSPRVGSTFSARPESIGSVPPGGTGCAGAAGSTRGALVESLLAQPSRPAPIEPGRNRSSVRPALMRSFTRFARTMARWLRRWVFRSCAALTWSLPALGRGPSLSCLGAPSTDWGSGPPSPSPA